MSVKISRKAYAKKYGPTKGDRIRLADSELIIEIERDHVVYGEESIFGGGKSIRDGQDQCPVVTPMGPPHCDLVITNAIVLDPLLGVVKGDIGVRDGLIVGVGKAGNPGIQDDIHPELIIGAGTEIIAGEHTIVTAGAIDTHVHFIAPQQAEQALTNGITTLFGGGTGPTDATNGCTCTPGPWNIQRMLEASEGMPINIGIMGKGN